jgi:Tol biopolymer transport system component
MPSVSTRWAVLLAASAIVAPAVLGLGEATPEAAPSAAIPVATKASVSGRIAYESFRGGIWTMKADGSHRHQVTHTRPGVDFNPDWAPSGKRLVFRTRRGHHQPDPQGIGVDGIFVIDTSGRHEHPVHPPSGGLSPDWSPDGRLLVMSGVSAGVEVLFTVHPDGTHLRNLKVSGEDALWSPDGRKLVFGWHGPGEEWQVWVSAADGSNAHALTHPPVDPQAPLGTAGDGGALWSPDGEQIAFSRGAGINRDLWLMNADGSDQHRILRWRGADSPNVWLPNGRIVFAHYAPKGVRPRWFLVNTDGSHLRSIRWLDGVAADPLDWLMSRPR